jgi:DNA processing protein
MRRIAAEWDAAVRRDVSILARDDPEYPSLLAALPDAPVVLYLKGALHEGRVRMAMVGSRRATAYGRLLARSLAAEPRGGSASRSSPGRARDRYMGSPRDSGSGRRTAAVLGCGFGHVPTGEQRIFAAIAASEPS